LDALLAAMKDDEGVLEEEGDCTVSPCVFNSFEAENFCWLVRKRWRALPSNLAAARSLLEEWDADKRR
jgi:hypothetical protein